MSPSLAQSHQEVHDLGLRPVQFVGPWLTMTEAAAYLRKQTASGTIRWCRKRGVILRDGGKGWLVARADLDRALLHTTSVRRSAA